MTTTTQPSYGEVVAGFVQQLEVEPTGIDRFTGAPDRDEGRLFGGLVMAQAMMAAGRTVEAGRDIHSLHAYFLRPGKPKVPVQYLVERPRDGRTFTARRVLAMQLGEAICDVTTSFARAEEGISHQGQMPSVASPDTLQDARDDYWKNEDGSSRPPWPFEVRFVTPPDAAAKPGEDPLSLEWVRIRAPLPNDPVIHAAALVYNSDAGSFAGIDRRYGGRSFDYHASASLDHALWFHHPVRWDGWILVVSDNPVAHAARAHTWRQMWSEDGVHVASMAQEAIVRRPRASKGSP